MSSEQRAKSHGACCEPASGRRTSGRPFAGAERSDGSTAGIASLLLIERDRFAYPADGEGPVREVEVGPFWINLYAVSNRDFDRFVAKTGYQTEAQRTGGRSSSAASSRRLPATRAVLRTVVAPGGRRRAGTTPKVPRSISGATRPPRRPRLLVRRLAYCSWAGSGYPPRPSGSRGARRSRGPALSPGVTSWSPEGEHRMNVWQGASRTRTRSTTDSSAPALWGVRAQRTSACSTRPATCGSGARTGSIRRSYRDKPAPTP